MTLPVSPNSISLSEINTEFSLGTNLNAYRGTTWYTDAGGSGTFSAGAISMSDFWGKRKTSPSFSTTISTNQTNLNLRTWAVNNGWDQTSAFVVTIGTSVYVYSTSTSTPALTIDGSWPGGVTVINNGYIMGKGGDGASDTNTGGAGGPAISLGVNCSIVNNSYIGGGGGGGGGYGGGGGAGGGNGNITVSGDTQSAGGAGGSVGNSGSNGRGPASGGGGRIFPGSGGTAGFVNSISFNPGYGGGAGGGGAANSSLINANFYLNINGGGGGGWGASGGAGRSSVGPGNGASGGTGGSGGATGGNGGGVGTPNPTPWVGGSGGKAIALNGYTVTTSGSGTTYGVVS